jgi:hypothetical protein
VSSRSGVTCCLQTGHKALTDVSRNFRTSRLDLLAGGPRDPQRAVRDPAVSLRAGSRAAFVMRARWTRADLLGYVSSWSAVARYRQRAWRGSVAGLLPESLLACGLTTGVRHRVARSTCWLEGSG